MTCVKPLSKLVGVLALALSLAFAGVALTGCGGSDPEQLIRDELTKELDSIKNMDQAFMDQMTSDPSISQLEEYGIDPTEFFQTFLEGFDYEIQSVEVDGDTADATVVLTTKSFSNFETELTDDVYALLEDPTILSMSEEELYAKVGETVMGTLGDLPLAQTDPITVTYTKEGNTWTPTSDSSAQIENALLSN